MYCSGNAFLDYDFIVHLCLFCAVPGKATKSAIFLSSLLHRWSLIVGLRLGYRDKFVVVAGRILLIIEKPRVGQIDCVTILDPTIA